MKEPQFSSALDVTIAAPGAERRPVGPMDDTLVGADGGAASVDAETLVGEHARGGGRARAVVEATKIGRYVVLGTLGAGGMGMVVAAYDPRLDRKVAIKLIHAPRRDDVQSRVRLEREAQATARLSHPNVVTIYEVGEHEGQLFLALEFVKGQDLGAWLAGRGKSADWREILHVFLQAGEGLAAAHAVGIVHRDFKPGNVFVGDDGRVRVGDFGLARRGGEVDARAMDAAEVHALAQDVTATGATLGTPAYMAPEQFAGAATDARTDQFAFCVALWEALYGQRPFAGETLAELAMAVTAGRRRPPPAGSAVPVWLRRVLERGLSQRPDERYATTPALLAALRADPTRRRRGLAIAAGLMAVIAGGVGVQRAAEARQVAACEAEGAQIAEVWNDAVQQRVHDALLATGVPFAATTAERVPRYFAAQAAAWTAGRTEACLNSRVRGSWDADTLARAEWCLDERRMELAALVAALSQASASAVQNAVTAAAKLSQVSACLDAERLARLPPPPENREGARAVLALLLRARAKGAEGSYDEGVAVAEEALARAQAFGGVPLVAAAHTLLGDLRQKSGNYEDGEQALRDGYFQAMAIGAWEVAVTAAQTLVYSAGTRHARPDEGRLWARHAEAGLALLGAEADALLRAPTLSNLAGIHFVVGEFAEAKQLYSQVRALEESALGPDHPEVASTLYNLGLVYESMGEYEEARALDERAREIFERALGPDHPSVGTALSSLASVEMLAGNRAEAKRLHEQVRELRVRALGPDHPEVADAINNVALVHDAAGEYEEAKALYEQARASLEKAVGPEHPHLAVTLANLAHVHTALGEHAEAKALLERALPMAERVLGPEHPFVATFQISLGDVYGHRREFAEAIARYERALAIQEKVFGPEHGEVGRALSGLANLYGATNRGEEARSLYARALAIQEQALGPQNVAIAGTLINFAALHLDTGAYDEARALAERGLAIQENAGADHPQVAAPLTLLALVALAQNRTADAVALAERAVALREAHKVRAELVAESRLALAQALVAEGRDRARALAVAREALEVFKTMEGRSQERAEAEALVKKLGRK